MAHTQPSTGGFRVGYLAILAGAAALLLAMIHIFGGPFAPQQPVGVSIGEIAGDIRASAWRALRGEPQPLPEPRGWDIDRILMLAAPIVGSIAIVLSIVSLIAREPVRLGKYGIWLGFLAIVVQFVWWLAVLIAVVAILTSVIENIGDIFGGIGEFFSGLFGGLFGG